MAREVVAGRNGVLILPYGEYSLSRATKMVRSYYERFRPRFLRQPARAPRATRTRRVSRRVRSGAASRDGPSLGDDDPEPPLSADRRKAAA
jgi:hypothetical protein